MFQNRTEAGKLLAGKLFFYKNKKDTLLLAIPRGGVEVASAIAKELKLPLDILVIKKLGYPGNEELALGAVSLDDHYLNEDLARDIPQEYIQEQVKIKQEEVKERYQFLRGKKPIYKVRNKTIIIIDDGLATGATMLMAVQIIKKQSPEKVIVAIPVAPPETVKKLERIANKVICLEQPQFFMALSNFYHDFKQLTDFDVIGLLTSLSKHLLIKS